MSGQLLHWLLPPRCLRCGEPLQRTGSPLFCPLCYPLFLKEATGGCPICRRPTVQCLCRVRHWPGRLVYALPYHGTVEDSPTRHLILAAKYRHHRAAHETLAAYMLEAARQVGLTEERDRVVTFIPRALSKAMSLGLDPADMLAKRYSQAQHLTCLPLFDHSERGKEQKTLETQDRLPNSLLNYRLLPHAAPMVAGRRVLLIDDVVTTGATVAVCAAALREAGATDVTVLAAAKSVSHANDGSSFCLYDKGE